MTYIYACKTRWNRSLQQVFVEVKIQASECTMWENHMRFGSYDLATTLQSILNIPEHSRQGDGLRSPREKFCESRHFDPPHYYYYHDYAFIQPFLQGAQHCIYNTPPLLYVHNHHEQPKIVLWTSWLNRALNSDLPIRSLTLHHVDLFERLMMAESFCSEIKRISRYPLDTLWEPRIRVSKLTAWFKW